MPTVKFALAAAAAAVVVAGVLATTLSALPAADDTLDGNERQWQLVTKSLDELTQELASIRAEARSRLAASNATLDAAARIRQHKVAKFVLARVDELELESVAMRAELAKLAAASRAKLTSLDTNELADDNDNIAFATSTRAPAATSAAAAATSSASPQQAHSSTTAAPADDAAAAAADGPKLDVEELKKLGEQIGKKLDELAKDAAKSLAALAECVKLVLDGGKNPARPAR